MNKRQIKKKRKKVVCPLVDELGILTLNAEEYRKAITDYQNYVLRHFSYYHYRDKQKLYRKPCIFVYPVGEACRSYMDELMKRTRRYPVKPTNEKYKEIAYATGIDYNHANIVAFDDFGTHKKAPTLRFFEKDKEYEEYEKEVKNANSAN